MLTRFLRKDFGKLTRKIFLPSFICLFIFLFAGYLIFAPPALAGEFSAFISGGGCYHPGEELRFNIGVSEGCLGGASCTNISSLSITDDFSSIYEYIEEITPNDGGVYDPATHKITWTLGPIPTPPILPNPSWTIAGVNFKIKLKSTWLEDYPDSFINSATVIINGGIPIDTNTVNVTIKTTYLPPGNTSPKKGVGRGWGMGNPEELHALGVSWAYSWGLGSDRDFEQDVYEFVPMIWGKGYNSSKVTSRASSDPGRYWLIWNEPDYWQQADISPTEAAQIYHDLRPLLKGADPTAKLIVGGIMNSAPGNALGWLREFRGEYYRLYGVWPVVEGWHAHLYMGWSNYNKDEWRRTVTYWRDWMSWNGGTVEFWLTEFGSLNSSGTARQIMADQVPWLETSAPWITRYAWFATMANGPGCPNCSGSLLLTSGCGGLSPLGQLYTTFGNPPPSPTPTPTPVFTLQFFKGWNSLFWQVGFPTNKKPSILPSVCIAESRNTNSFWKPFMKVFGGEDSLFVVDRRYPVWCRETVSWPFN